MVLASGDINIIADMEGTTGVKLHNNRQKLRNRFDIVRKLGQGTYGKVQLAVNKDTGEEVAIKTIRKSKIETEQDLVRIQREIQIMSSVQHPHIIHIYEVFENKEKIVLVMEYASGGELYDYLSYKKFLEEHEARRVFRQVVAAVYYCHKNMICHRDLKLENILLDEKGNAKIADFGLSNVFDDKNFLNTFCGSPLYASPEIVQGTPYYGPEVDCWSLGVLLYTLVYGAMPFDGSNFKRLVKQISEGDYYEPKELSDASSLIRKMLTVSPTKRANIDDISTDQWVDAGEDVSLASVSQEFCNQMPVRLDYLLALTAADDSQLSPVDETQIEGKIGPEPPSAPVENEMKPESQVESDIIDSEHVPNEIKDEKPLEPDVKEEKTESKDDNSDKLATAAASEEPKLAESDNNIEECQPEEQLQEAPVDIPVEPSKEVADTGKETVTVKDKGVGVKRVSSFGKKVSLKTPLVKSKTSSEGVAPKLNGTTSKIGKLKKSGSETEGADNNKVGVERKPWVSAGAKSSSIKSPNPIPTSPTGKYSPTTKLTKTGSLDKPEVGPQSDVSKPPPRATRVGSPVKQFHDSAHHKGCTPPEAVKVAQAEAKKSPPKAVVSKRPSQVPTREVSPKKYTAGAKPAQQREKESPKRQINGSRPRSPIKSVKVASDKAVKSPVTTPELEGTEHPLKSVANEKRGSIEIAPLKITRNYAESGADETTDQTQPQPQVSFTPKDKGGFTLLGVKSEVMFDVDTPPKSPPPNPEPVAVAEVEKVKSEDNNKVIKYVATVKKHGKDLTKPDDGPERVNILKLKCAPSDDDLGGQAVSASSDSIKEQRGYNVYRSKYRSIQKYRSVVEHQVGRVEDEAEVEEEEEELSKRKEAEVEHCDSFSSAGSNDDLEDVFESLNSETMFSSLLSRTRHLIQRLSSGHIGISTNSSGGSSFSFNSPGISLLLTTNGQNQKSSATTANVSGSRRYGRSTSRSSQESEQSHRRYLDDTSGWERRSRYEDFLASSRAREDPQRELISSFLRNRNQSLDSTRRPRSYYGSATTGCLPGTRRSREDFSSTQDKDALDQFHHYSKSYSRQVSEESVESSSTHSSRLQHPRSYLAGNPNLNSGSSVHRDYSRSVSQTGGTSHAEEEETKQEHRVSEGRNQRSEVIKKECKRSVSHSESRVSSNKKDENLSRQDSGIESMFDVNSPTSAVADKSSSRPPPVKEEINEHPLAGRQQMKPDDDDDDSSIHVSDSGETGSVGSDSTSNDHWANSTSPSHISPSRSCGEESVGDRIRRKSFYARFNESRNPRNKARKQTTGLPTSVPSNAHLRHLLFDSDPFLESRNSHFDSLHQGDYYSHHRSPSQRWSMHLHSPTGLPESDYFSPSSSFNIQSDASSTLPRRSSFTGAPAGEDHGGAGPSMTRTHSLPEESNAPTDNASGSSLHSTGSLRRPRRLDLYDRSSLIGGPSLEDSLTSGRRSTWRHVPSASSSYRDPLESWDTPHYTRPNVGNALTSLMDSLESPSEVLQKAMELCDSLRKVK